MTNSQFDARVLSSIVAIKSIRRRLKAVRQMEPGAARQDALTLVQCDLARETKTLDTLVRASFVEGIVDNRVALAHAI